MLLNMLKNYTLFILLAGLSFACSKPEETAPKIILQRNITLSSQADIEKFAADYQHAPEIGIDGNIVIGKAPKDGYSDIKSLKSLSKLTGISKNLVISMNNQLESLEGLENLGYVGGTLRIQQTALADNIDLSSLRRVDDSLVVEQNPQLRSLTGLSGLKKVGSIRLSANPQLEDLHGLEKITSLKSLYLDKNDKLVDLAGLERLKLIKDNLYVLVNKSLSSLSGLDSLERVGKNVAFYGVKHVGPDAYNAALTNISLPNLRYIGGDLHLENIKSTQTLALPLLDTIAGTLRVVQANGLSSLAGLPALAFVGKDAVISKNPFTDLAGLANLKVVKGALQVQENTNLTTLQGLAVLQEAATVQVKQNQRLSNLCTLKAAIEKILSKNASPSLQIIDLSGNAKGAYTYQQLLDECT